MNDRFANFITHFGEILNILVTIGIFGIGYILQRRARMIQKLMTWNQYREPIKQFADEVVTAMSEAEALCEVNPEIKPDYFWERYNKTLAKLSSLRDRGKFIIPNYVPSAKVADRNAAYNGIRHEAMECVSVAYKASVALDYKCMSNNHKRALLSPLKSDEESCIQLEKIKKALSCLPQGYPQKGFKEKGWSCKAAIVEAKRQFVSISQELLEPKKWSDQIKKVVK